MGPILGIETSCDETSVALVTVDGEILVNRVASQIALHRPYRGVVPEIASRAHLRVVEPLLEECLGEAGVARAGIGGVAATRGPGLASSLLIGLTFCKSLAARLGVPFVAVHHLAAHFYALVLEARRSGLDPPEPPLVGLAVSGGHTLLCLVETWDSFRILGQTLDDAAGEAFDKVASILGLGYPGGPAIDRVARAGNPLRFNLPEGLADRPETLDFSFSGLKTAVLYAVRDRPPASETDVADMAASFQESVVNALVKRAKRALKLAGLPTLGVVGGVACNSRLRSRLEQTAGRDRFELRIPGPDLCTDNAAMIAGLGGWMLKHGCPGVLDADAVPDLALPREGDPHART